MYEMVTRSNSTFEREEKVKAFEIAQLVHEHLTAAHVIFAFQPSEDQSEQ
jgi:hypothetical protein